MTGSRWCEKRSFFLPHGKKNVEGGRLKEGKGKNNSKKKERSIRNEKNGTGNKGKASFGCVRVLETREKTKTLYSWQGRFRRKGEGNAKLNKKKEGGVKKGEATTKARKLTAPKDWRGRPKK